MSVLSRILRPFSGKSLEGQYREGPYHLPYTGGFLSADVGQYLNWWQMGHDPQGGGSSAMVEACVNAYSQTVSMCPGDHWRAKANGGRERVTNSDLSRVIKEPNDYQSISDFLLNLVRSLYVDGNAYALALRNNRTEVDSLHLMHSQSSTPVVRGGEIFYSLAGNEIVSQRLLGESNRTLVVPARDVLHIKFHTTTPNILKGESPLRSVMLDLATSNEMAAQNLAFYRNQAKPSFVLTTDQKYTAEQMKALHEAMNSRAQGGNQGKTMIFTDGMKPVPISMSAQDSQMVEIMRLADQRIATALGVPLQILGLSGGHSGSGAGGATAQYMEHWLNSSLGAVLNLIEESFDRFFGLDGQPDEYLELSTNVLLRSNLKDRITSWKEGVTGGIFSPNEARAEFELADVEFGDEPRVQQQMVPLSAAAGIPAAPPAPGQKPASGPKPASPDAAPTMPSDATKDFDFDRDRALSRLRRAQNAAVAA